MKQEERNALSRQKILEAAMKEFAGKGYDRASLNTICAENHISKGIIYHYFKDKDEIYLLCVSDCFEMLTAYLAAARRDMTGSVERRLAEYFDARLRFFAENPLCLGIFIGAALDPPAALRDQIAGLRSGFDELNISVLTDLLSGAALRRGFSIQSVAEDFRMYMDYFHLRFRDALAGAQSPEEALFKHEERCRRQLKILLYGVLVNENENN